MRMAGYLRTLVAIVMATAMHSVAQATDRGTCTNPGLLKPSIINIIVLPYVDYTTKRLSQVESQSGTELAGLIQEEALLLSTKYSLLGDVGVAAAVRLTGSPQECQVDKVFARLRSTFGKPLEVNLPAFLDTDVVIFIWGRFFREGKDLYVQSYARFRRLGNPDPGEMLQLTVGGEVFAAPLATESFTFAPRYISRQDFVLIQQNFLYTALVHKDPDDNSPARPLSNLLHPGALYGVGQPSGFYPWYEISTSLYDGGTQGGWVRTNVSLGSATLEDRLPELKFVNGIVGYFGSRAEYLVGLFNSPVYNAEPADAALRDYEKSITVTASPETVAVAYQLRALLFLLKDNQTRKSFQMTLPLVEEAAHVLPASSNARNLVGVIKTYLALSDQTEGIALKPLLDEFWTALSLDSADTIALTNCWTLYNIALSQQLRSKLRLPAGVSVGDLENEKSAITHSEIHGKPVNLVRTPSIDPWPSRDDIEDLRMK